MTTTSPDRNGRTDRPTDATLDGVMRLLADPRQRALCRFLDADDRDSVPFDDLVDVLVDESVDAGALDRSTPTDGESPEVETGTATATRAEATVDLVQCRLPTLDRAGVVDYCPAERTVRYRGGATVETLLRTADALSEGEREKEEEKAVAAGDRADGAERDLAVDRRRIVLDLLDEHASLTLADLADEVAERDHDASITQIDADAVLDVYLDLATEHVPRLAAEYLVRYDEERELVSFVGRDSDATVDRSAERGTGPTTEREPDSAGQPGTADDGGASVTLSEETVELLRRVAPAERSADGPASYDDRIRAALSRLER